MHAGASVKPRLFQREAYELVSNQKSLTHPQFWLMLVCSQEKPQQSGNICDFGLQGLDLKKK